MSDYTDNYSLWKSAVNEWGKINIKLHTYEYFKLVKFLPSMWFQNIVQLHAQDLVFLFGQNML